MAIFNCIIGTERFPNAYTTYILNQIEYIIHQGGRVSIISGKALGQEIDERVHRYGLLKNTYSYSFNSAWDYFKGLSPFVNPFNHKGLEAYRGLWKIIRSQGFKEYDMRKKAKSIVKAQILGNKQRYDLIHAHYMSVAYETLFIAKIFNIPIIVSFHGLQTNDLERPFSLKKKETDAVFKHAKIFTAGTEYAKRILLDFGCPESKIRIIPVGLNLKYYPFLPQSISKDKRVVFLTVGRLSPEKGHKYAIEAINIIREKGWNAEYRIIGHGPFRADLLRIIEEFKASEYILLLGEKSGIELMNEYEKAHIFILPSIREDDAKYAGETQGLVIQEAQACGKVVVATDAGGIPECVEEGISAFLVPEKNAEVMANKIDWILRHPERWEEWQKAGREWVETHYSMEVLGKKLFEIYRQAVNSTP